MATAAQIAANRANAQRSTGPSTPEGKARSAANSRKDGLTSANVHVPGAQRDEFDAYRRQLLADTRPEGALELEFFTRLLAYGWNLRRARALEAQLLYETDPLLDETAEFRLHRIARYRRDLERSHDRALRELRHLQTQRAALLQQDECVIDAVYSITPLAEISRLTNSTDAFIRANPVTNSFYCSRKAAVRSRHADLRGERNEADS